MLTFYSHPQVNNGKPIPLIKMGEPLPDGFMDTYFPNWPTLSDMLCFERAFGRKPEIVNGVCEAYNYAKVVKHEPA